MSIDKLNKLKMDRNEINEKILELEHKLFAEYLNEKINKLIFQNKNLMYSYDNGKFHYFVLAWYLSNEVFNWIFKNNVETREYNYNGVMVDIIDDYRGTFVRIRFENKAKEIEFIKDWKIKYAE